MSEKEFIIRSGQHFRTITGRLVVLKRIGGTITLEEPTSGKIHVLVTGYSEVCEMKSVFFHQLAANCLGEPLLASTEGAP